MTTISPATFTDALREVQQRINPLLERHLPAGALAAALAHAVLSGGKRLRPFLLLTAYRLGAPARPPSREEEEAAHLSAVAVEYVHAYSLVHDDLPSMDDGRLRHGRPSVHRAFGEAQAILVGDALLTRAFEVIPDAGRLLLSGAASEMVEGQAQDLSPRTFSEEGLIGVHRLKTGALMAAACEIGGVLAGMDARGCGVLRSFGSDLGVAFQLADDLLKDGDKSSAREGGPSARHLGEARARLLAAQFAESAQKHLMEHLRGYSSGSLLGSEAAASLLHAAADFACRRA